jgi:hypothetical protein
MNNTLSPQRKRLMVQLIITCELYDLTEKEALSFIKRKLGTSISRRTFYEYKKALYQTQILKKTESFLPNLGPRSFRRLFPERTYLNSESELAKRYSNIIGLDFIPESSYKVFSDSSTTIGKSRNFFGRLNKLKETSARNYESVPQNATIREEYVKCGNYSCGRCKHGPYYYAYWRDQGKRYKKYLEKYDTRDKKSLKLIDLSPFTSDEKSPFCPLSRTVLKNLM